MSAPPPDALNAAVAPVARGCDFHESYFGASYPDACCIDGMLWDLDSCDVPGGPLFSGGDVHCPQCNHDAWLDDFKDEVEMEGYEAFEKKEPRKRVYKAVRHEQPKDRAKMGKWFSAGWDLAKSELAAHGKSA